MTGRRATKSRGTGRSDRSELVVDAQPDRLESHVGGEIGFEYAWFFEVEERLLAEVDVEIFGLQRPVVGECVFGAGACRPAGARILRRRRVANGTPNEGNGFIAGRARGFAKRQTTGAVNHQALGRHET